jgi:hypothetical protein
MSSYRVTWVIDIEAESKQAAALTALRIQRDPSSIATVFEVADANGTVSTVDLHGDAPHV